MNKNFDSRLHENQYLENAYSFIDSINNRLNNDYKKSGFEIYNQDNDRFNGSIIFRKSISHTKPGKVTYYDYVKFISIDYNISLDGFINFIINKIDKSPINELGKLKLDISNNISNSDYRKLIDIISKAVKINKNFSKRIRRCFSEKYTQVFDFSIEGKLLPRSFEQDVINAGYKIEDTSSTAGHGGLDSIAIEVEREPTDKLDEVVNFIANKFNVDKSKVQYTKWD